jgi:hypothetical protein
MQVFRLLLDFLGVSRVSGISSWSSSASRVFLVRVSEEIWVRIESSTALNAAEREPCFDDDSMGFHVSSEIRLEVEDSWAS